MVNAITRPKSGLNFDEAFDCWADQDRYRKFLTSFDLPFCLRSKLVPDKIADPQRLKQFRIASNEIDAEFLKLLEDGEIFASGIRKFADCREAIHPSLWRMLSVRCDLDLIVGSGKQYEHPEFFDLCSIPQNIRPIPDWLDELLGEAGMNKFRFDRSYRHIVLNGIPYSLSPLQGEVVRILHAAYRAGDAWVNGKELLERAGSKQFKMSEVFKSRDWEAIIERDGTMYRLRLEDDYAGTGNSTHRAPASLQP